ncbi:MAG: AGE family epimerase/isomerase, partial [Micrococcales bacterium]|nr:AGE family epimerase/isomerase [Micrococcales bacterium]
MVPQKPVTPAYLASMANDLLSFGRAAHSPIGGFGYLDQTGRIDPTYGHPLWITCRMTHCYALGALLGHPGAPALVDHGLAALAGEFADRTFGGWFAALSDAGSPVQTAKQAYGHAFIVLAASSAALAGRPGAQPLLAKALTVMEQRFWDNTAQAVVDGASQDFSQIEPYRGANANMHTVEAFSAAAEATGQNIWLERALAISHRIINVGARGNGWRIPEHYESEWKVNLDYNKDTPADQFRPFGATPGHGFEWARLLVQLQAQLGKTAPDWLVDAALALYDRAA